MTIVQEMPRVGLREKGRSLDPSSRHIEALEQQMRSPRPSYWHIDP